MTSFPDKGNVLVVVQHCEGPTWELLMYEEIVFGMERVQILDLARYFEEMAELAQLRYEHSFFRRSGEPADGLELKATVLWPVAYDCCEGSEIIRRVRRQFFPFLAEKGETIFDPLSELSAFGYEETTFGLQVRDLQISKTGGTAKVLTPIGVLDVFAAEPYIRVSRDAVAPTAG
ncbi:MAG: hypothetical protein HONBIEJF_02587 [Fimbriimonadaceae bacterium]|nr:hypothetical protein [Fimbriimonadaceae bacterium]